jgi:hypothetical protein
MSTSSTKSVSFEASRTANATAATAAPASYGPTLAYKGPSNFCVKKGKWYDCLRPVPGYKQFGGMGADIDFSTALGDTRRGGEDESWCGEGDRREKA